jgi:hypothetical protein
LGKEDMAQRPYHVFSEFKEVIPSAVISYFGPNCNPFQQNPLQSKGQNVIESLL